MNSAATKRKVAKVTSEILKIHGVTQADLDKARQEKIALGIESASAVEAKTNDPKLKKVKVEKFDDPKGKTDDTPPAPKETIDLTAPPEYKEIPKRKKEISTTHPSSRATRSNG